MNTSDAGSWINTTFGRADKPAALRRLTAVFPINMRKPAVIRPCQVAATHLGFSGFSIFGGIMKTVRAGAAAVSSLTIGPQRNEDVPRSFQPTYHPEAAAGPQFMTPSPAFQSDSAKKYLNLAALILTIVPIIASIVLLAMATFGRSG